MRWNTAPSVDAPFGESRPSVAVPCSWGWRPARRGGCPPHGVRSSLAWTPANQRLVPSSHRKDDLPVRVGTPEQDRLEPPPKRVREPRGPAMGHPRRSILLEPCRPLLQERLNPLAIIRPKVDISSQTLQMLERRRIDRDGLAQHAHRLFGGRNRRRRSGRNGSRRVIYPGLELRRRHDRIDHSETLRALRR